MADVFISYAHTTSKQAQAAAAALRGAGFSVWLDDDLAVHREFTQAIEEQLTAAKAALVMWSADAARSAWVLSEANRAREDRKLVQLVIDKTRLPMPFDQVQCADLSGWSGEGEHPNWRRVTASIRELVEGRSVSSPPAPPARETANDERRLAVLAFDNLSGDPEMAYFSDGVSEEIQQSVSRGADLKVIGRTSSFHYRGADKTVRRVASDLNATHVLDGAVRRSGSRVRISAQLIECAHETTLWSDRFDGPLDDVFSLQDEIASAVAAALKVVFAAAAAKSVPVDPTAYELYLKASELMADSFHGSSALETAIGLLERATSDAPNFARAWSALARSRASLLRVYGSDEPIAERAKAVEAAETALRLDPSSGVAYVALAGLEPAGRYAEQEALLEQALSVASNDPEVIAAMSRLLAQVGRAREALVLAKRGFDLDPRNLRIANRYAVALSTTGRHREACELLDRLIGVWPEATTLYWNAVFFAGAVQQWGRVEAVVELAKKRGLYEGDLRDLGQFVQNLKTKEAGYGLRYLEYARGVLDRTGNVREHDFANLCRFGLFDEAFDLVERASFDFVTDPERPRRGDPDAGAIFQCTELMSDPRFARLCARLGLCDYWVQSDHWPDCADGVSYDFRAEARRLVGAAKRTS